MPETPKKSWRDKFSWIRKPQTKKEWALVGLLVLLLIVFGYLLYGHFHHKPVVYKKVPVKVAPVAKTVASNLTGLQVDPAFNKRPVTGVMIENSTFARPQSGLSEAGVVFEAIAEGGITRFLALFQDTTPEVGPVRSARPYYLQWALGFNAGYAHVGGSPEALQDIKDWGVRDLDQFFNSPAYRREASREAPHNVYTNVTTLIDLENSKGYTSSKFTGFPRKKEVKPKATPAPTARVIDFNISGADFNVHYDYDTATNSYLRGVGGAAHTDANSNTQIHPKNVVALIMTYGLEEDDHHSAYGVIGSGQAFVFMDGKQVVGTWTKPDSATQITLTDAANKPIKLNPGQTWFTALADAGRVTSAP